MTVDLKNMIVKSQQMEDMKLIEPMRYSMMDSIAHMMRIKVPHGVANNLEHETSLVHDRQEMYNAKNANYGAYGF